MGMLKLDHQTFIRTNIGDVFFFGYIIIEDLFLPFRGKFIFPEPVPARIIQSGSRILFSFAEKDFLFMSVESFLSKANK
jgi:hypothetical protein